MSVCDVQGLIFKQYNECVCDVQGLVDAHEQFKATLGEADKEYTTIVSLSQEVIRLGQQCGLTPPDNPYTTLHAQVRTARRSARGFSGGGRWRG